MTIAEREQQILRVREQGFYREVINTELADRLRTEVVGTVKTVPESALNEEVSAFLGQLEGEKPHRFGFYHRG
jgi:hypothetical protein